MSQEVTKGLDPFKSNNSLLQARWEGPHFSDLWTFAIGADASDLEAPETAVVRTRVVKCC